MFIVKEYVCGQTELYCCRTIEKAKEIFERIFWKWVEKETSGIYSSKPMDYNANTWEELLATCWEDGMEWDEVVRCEQIECEEDKIGA